METNQVNDSQTLVSEETPESQATSVEQPTEFLDNSAKEPQNLDNSFADIEQICSRIIVPNGFVENLCKELDKQYLMNECSSPLQELEEFSSEILKIEENTVIAAGDTSELELNLSKNIADLETVVSGCYGSNIKNYLTKAFSNFTEVNEADEINADTPILKDVEPTVNSGKATDNKTVNKMENVSKKENKTPKEGSIEKDSNKETKNEKVFQPETNLVSKETDDDKNSRKQQKYSGSAKKKGDKSIDKILKSLSNCSTTEEKLQTLCQRLLETQEELRMLHPRMKQLERQVQNQLREKEQLQTDYNRMVLAKSKLEILCRKLQRQNKAVKVNSSQKDYSNASIVSCDTYIKRKRLENSNKTGVCVISSEESFSDDTILKSSKSQTETSKMPKSKYVSSSSVQTRIRTKTLVYKRNAKELASGKCSPKKLTEWSKNYKEPEATKKELRDFSLMALIKKYNDSREKE